MNRRRITDPRERPPSIQATLRSFLSLSLGLSSRCRIQPDFFFFFHQPQNRKTIRRLARLPVLSSKTLSDFRCRYFVPFFLLARSIVGDDLGRARLKSRVPAKNAGRLSGAIVSSEHESRHNDVLRTYLASCYRHSSGEKREAIVTEKSCTTRSDQVVKRIEKIYFYFSLRLKTQEKYFVMNPAEMKNS